MRRTASATLAGSFTSSQPCGLPVFTEQNLQARVHTEPMSISVAVPRPQHSAMFGHLDSAHTVDSWCVFTISMISWYLAPLGRRTRSHWGLGPMSGTALRALGLMPSWMACVPCSVTNLVPEPGRRGLGCRTMVSSAMRWASCACTETNEPILGADFPFGWRAASVLTLDAG